MRAALTYDITIIVLQFGLFLSKLSFRTLYDFDLNQAIDVYDFVVNGLNPGVSVVRVV